MALTSPVFLLGFMCSGKTTLGRALATCLHVEFVDLDEYIESLQGRKVSDIFAAEGESGFRAAERLALETIIEATRDKGCVVALGGGTPCQEGIMELLNDAGTTVWLKPSEDVLSERLVYGAATRPLLAGKSPEDIAEFARDMQRRRDPYYRRARHVFDSSRLEDTSMINESVNHFIEAILTEEA